MKFIKQNATWILIAAVIMIVVSQQQVVPKEAIADSEGMPCTAETLAEDCPCIGDRGDNEFGIGMGTCSDGTCDMTYCINVQPVSQWVKDKPLQWVKDNIMLTVGLIAVLSVALFLPKQ